LVQEVVIEHLAYLVVGPAMKPSSDIAESAIIDPWRSYRRFLDRAVGRHSF
jgi:hypothetical protein